MRDADLEPGASGIVAGPAVHDVGARTGIGPKGVNWELDARFHRINLPSVQCPQAGLRTIFLAGDLLDPSADRVGLYPEETDDLLVLRIRIVKTHVRSPIEAIFGSTGLAGAAVDEVIQGRNPGSFVRVGIDHGLCLAGVRLGDAGVVAGRLHGEDRILKPAYARAAAQNPWERTTSWLRRVPYVVSAMLRPRSYSISDDRMY